MRRMPWLQLLCVLTALWSITGHADDWAVPPGQEAVLERAVTPTRAWPKGWKLQGVRIVGAHIDVAYATPDRGAIGVRLDHAAGDSPALVMAPISAILPPEVETLLRGQLAQVTLPWTDLRPATKPTHLPAPATDAVETLGQAALRSGQHAQLAALGKREEARGCALRTTWVGQLFAAGKAEDFALALDLAQTPTPCADALDTVGRWTATLGQPAQGVKLLQQALTLTPGAAVLVFDLALLQRQAGDCPGALATLKSVDLRKVPDVAKELARLSRIWIDCPDDALLQQTRQAADATPPDPIAAFMAGAVLHHEGAWRTSDTYLAKSQTLMADEPRQYLYRAMNAWHDGRQADAESLVAKASALGSQDPDVLYCRASIVGDKHPQDAIRDLETYEQAMAHTADRTDGKQERVSGMLADLRACQAEADVHTCRDRAALHRKMRGKVLPAILPALLILGILAAIWRRRKDLDLTS